MSLYEWPNQHTGLSKMLIADVIAAHAFCHNNRGMTGPCGCFYCEQVFDASEIVKWTKDDCAICPKCSIDSVIPGNKVRIDPEALRDMYAHWFAVETVL
jgi:hypothetical protein